MTEEINRPSVYPQFSGDLLSRTNLFVWIREFIRNTGQSKGCFVEFGVQNGESVVDAYRQLRGEITEIFGFDSFEGIPDLSNPVDEAGSSLYTPAKTVGGYNSIDIDAVRGFVESACRIPANRLHLEKGFFNQTMNNFDVSRFKEAGNVSICHIDINSYEPCLDILNFIKPHLLDGAWILFDDYWAYGGNKNYGVRKAISEWSTNSVFQLDAYCNFRGFGKAFVFNS